MSVFYFGFCRLCCQCCPNHYEVSRLSVVHVRASVSTAVVQNNQVLLVQEASPRKRGLWNLPSGRLDPGEAFLEAAIREVWEETGYPIEVMGVVGVYSYTSASARQVVRCMYRARPNGLPSPHTCDEVMDVCWHSLEGLHELADNQLWAPHILRPMLEDVRQGRLYPVDLVKSFG